ncbi:MAG: methylenetetrahydrofolate reductase [Spirochaetia bacterium]|jgi:methylenetetrahydrofolate reductase (NADPH)|nr:methylenetetrahydrofolate reductase [Spirochaetia bacterium]
MNSNYDMFHVEVLPPHQDAEDLEVRLDRFATRYKRVLDAGYCACITDNAMGNMSFQGTEIIEEYNLPVNTENVMIHVNTFHSKRVLDDILKTCIAQGIRYLLVVSGDGNVRFPKLNPSDLGIKGVSSVTAVELLKYINREYSGVFILGVAFNPYEPEEEELEKMDRKIEAGAEFVITQPIIEKNPVVDRLISRIDIPVIVEAWMSKKLHLLSDCVGYEIPEDTEYDPIATLALLQDEYPSGGVYLAMMNYKRQFNLLSEIPRQVVI